MQVVDILGDEGQTPAPRAKAGFKIGERKMGRIRINPDEAPAAEIVKL